MNFDKSLENKWFSSYLKNIRVVILLVIGILVIGIFSVINLPKRLNPEVKLTIVSVVTVLPGAGPSDVETLLTIPLEDKLLGLKGIDTITSSSVDNVSAIVIQFLTGIDKDKARNDVQAAVTEVSNLPTDAKTPKVTALDFEDTPIWNFTLTAKGDLPSLMRYADSLKTKIADLPNIDRVTLTGFDTQEIQVLVDPEKISSLGINPIQLSSAIKTSTVAFPAGLVKSDGSSFAITIDADTSTIEDVRNLRFNISGKSLKLGDISTVSFKSKPNQSKTFLATKDSAATRGVNFFVYKSSSADITKTVKGVEELVNSEMASKNGEFKITTIVNTGEKINTQFIDVIGEFKSTIILVFINLLLFLGLRQALIASITIPLTFLMSFTWMSGLGQTINFVSLFALLLAFGTSIDDTIVTVSALTKYFETKKFSPHEAGLLVWRDFVIPIWTTTVTTVWAFLPLILTTGIIGEFIKPIPITVATTMYSSTFVSWFITLPLMIVLLKPNIPERLKKLFGGIALPASIYAIYSISPNSFLIVPIIVIYLLAVALIFKYRKLLASEIKRKITSFIYWKKIHVFLTRISNQGLINTEEISQKYHDLISRILKSKKARRIVLTGLTIYAVVAFSLLPLGLVKNEFFPKTNGDNLYVNVTFPAGTSLEVLENESSIITEKLRKTSELQSLTTEIGRATSSNGGESDSPNTILFSIILNPKEGRKLTSMEISDIIRKELVDYDKGKVVVTEPSSGPPAGSDVAIKLVGDDLDILNQYADKIINFLSREQGITNVDKSIKSGTGKITFVPDKDKIIQAGTSIDSLGFWLRTSISGFQLDTLKVGETDQNIVFYMDSGSLSPTDLGRINVPTQLGQVPLNSLGHFELKNNPTIITRESGKRTVSVFAGVLPGYSVSDANKSLIKFVGTELNLPQGYSWKTGGVNEENTKSVTSILKAMILSFILIMATMVIEFGSYRQAAMILSIIPFAVSGVFYVFGLTGTPLSFPALIGVMALFGVVVTNAMFIVEKINQNRKKGMHIDHAIADAGKSRLEPILLTSLTSILGLIPITLGNALWRGLGGAIISGLLFSGIIMLFYIPTMYKTIYSKEE
jgi:HAE1 family hydrophobic/amphiphilic exporter-1